MRPFKEPPSPYWVDGLIVPATGGGYWAIRGRTTPAGTELFCAGVDERGGLKYMEGWPPDVSERYCWGTPDDGGPECVCRKGE